MTKKPCAVPKCTTGNKSDKGKCSVFQVPKDVERCKKWQAAISGVVLKLSHYVCEKHFDEKCILREWIKRDANGCIIARAAYKRPTLDKSAVPTIFNSNQTAHRLVACISDDGMDLKIENIIGSATEQSFSDVIVDMSTEGPSKSRTDEPEILQESMNNTVPLEKCSQSEVVSSHETLNHGITLPESACNQPEINLQEAFVEREVDLSEVDIHRDKSPIDFMESSSQFETDTARNAYDCPVTIPEASAHDRDFDISNITINDLTIEVAMKSGNRETCSVSIPKLWGVTKLSTVGQKIAFLHVVTKRVNGIDVPIIAKSVTIQTNRRLVYCAYGRAVDPEKCELVQFLNDPTLLPQTLDRFKNMNVCDGLGAVNTRHLLADSVFQDNTERWRHNDCPMTSKRKRCEHCMSMRERVLRRETRSKGNWPLTRINLASNPIDQRKLLALRKKNDRVRRLKNRAKLRGQLLR